jgi:quinol monooxygenase YgiN
MTCQVLLEFRVKEGSIENLRKWMREILPDTRGYDGCISIALTQNQDSPNDITVVEQWETRGHYEKYLQWRTDSGVMTDLVDMMDGDPAWRFFDYIGV